MRRAVIEVAVSIVVLLAAMQASFARPSPAQPPAEDAPRQQTAPVPSPTGGHLVFEEGFYDFGQVKEGDVVRHTFRFRNDGTGPVKIVDTRTSCGCTTAKAALRSYAPGEQGEMEVAVDTVGKKGIVVKTVTLSLEGSRSPTVELSLTMSLVPPPHPEKVRLTNLNADPRCKSCHLESGREQTGIFLYHRVCSQCHGKKGVGGMARALNDAQWQGGVDDEYIRRRIREGWAERGMPSFVAGVTPPLDDGQVDSLVRYVREMGGKPE